MGYIYKITNQLNEKAYIGQTTQPVEVRWYAHIYSANREDDNRYYFQRALQKDGVNNFKFEILEEIPNEQLNEHEQYWIKFYHTYRYDPQGNEGYNLTWGGEGNYKFEPEVLLKAFYDNNQHLRNTCKAIGCCEPTLIKVLKENGLHGLGSQRPIYQISPQTGEIIKRYEACIDAAQAMKIAHNTLWCALNGDQKTAAGFVWCYVDSFNKFNLKEHKDNKFRQIRCVETDTVFESVTAAAKWISNEIGDNAYKNRMANICTSCKSPKRKAYGYKWEYAD